jgi:DNA polymerase-1
VSTLYIIDGTSYIYRAFHAIRKLSTSDGRPTNAVYGFAQMLQKVLREHATGRAVIVFDSKEKNFRHKLYPEYKANRSAPPEGLIEQIPAIRELVGAFGVPVLEVPGYEADDVIGTIAVREASAGRSCVIVTGDKDLMQLVNQKVVVYDPMKERRYDTEGVRERFGVPPHMVADLLALAGDSSDNIPGVRGVGEVIAARLIAEYGPVEWLYRNLGAVKQDKLRQKLEACRDEAILSKKLATIVTSVPVETGDATFLLPEPDWDAIEQIYRKHEFRTPPRPAGHKRAEPVPSPGVEVGVRAGEALNNSFITVLDGAALELMALEIAGAKEVSVDTETTSTEPMRAHLVGVSVGTGAGRAFYVPLSHRSLDAPRQLPWERVRELLARSLEGRRIVTQNGKYDLIVLKRHGLDLRVDDDTMIASYLLDPEGSHGLKNLSRAHLGHEMLTYDDVMAHAGGEGGFESVPVDLAARYSCDDAEVTLRLMGVLREKLGGGDLARLYREVEMPLVPVLAEMEMAGVLVDRARLEAMSVEIAAALEREAQEIYAIAGTEFNIGSPKQLAEILFERMGLKVVKRGKSGASTDSQVLEELAGESEIAGKVLSYRSLVKLRGTYIDALPVLINPATGRIHCSFNQTSTATGRLSSSSPNLQNIPIRTPLGRTIREAFMARPGYSLISADYSQIELRVLAHFSGDKKLIEAFRAGEDIHRRTASEIFSVAPGAVTADQRRAAKTINFGIVYGMGAFALSRDLGIKRAEAQVYIDGYFARIPGVKQFIEATVCRAREDGFVSTLMGRRRAIPGLTSRNDQIRRGAERMAVNTPIQGSAADIIKVAMIRLAPTFSDDARLLLQVHDELLFEVKTELAQEFSKKAAQVMEDAAALKVPLKVDVGIAPNWAGAH